MGSGAHSRPSGGGGSGRQAFAPLHLSRGTVLTYPLNEATTKDRTRRLLRAARNLINPSVLPARGAIATAATDG